MTAPNCSKHGTRVLARSTTRAATRTLARLLALGVLATSAAACREQGRPASETPAAGAHAHSHDSATPATAISHYTCSMHPSVRSETPGNCPICSMDLVPVTAEEVSSGEVLVDEGRRQRIGIRTAPVESKHVTRELRATGKVTYDEAGLAEVAVKYGGWIERLDVNATGQSVRRGQTLFTIYSPELYAAQDELLIALRSQATARNSTVPERADYLVQASRQRLRLWDLSEQQIDQIIAGGKPVRQQPVLSPVSGYVIERNVVAGASVEPGMALYRIAALDHIWVEASLPESELALIKVGQEGTITLPYESGEKLTGKVSAILPYLDGEARTGRVRISLPNRNRTLKPEMFADVTFQIDQGERLLVPDSAVLYSGPRRIVFLDLGEGRLKPREIQITGKSGAFFEVASGLAAGDLVVTSGTFLVAAESRLKSATEQWQ